MNDLHFFLLGLCVAAAFVAGVRLRRHLEVRTSLLQVSLKITKLNRMSSTGEASRNQYRGALVALSMVAEAMGHERTHDELHELWQQAWDNSPITNLPGSELSFVPDLDSVALPLARLAWFAREYLCRRCEPLSPDAETMAAKVAEQTIFFDAVLDGEGPAASYFKYLFYTIIPQELGCDG